MHLDEAGRLVYDDGKTRDLPALIYRALKHFFANEGRIVSRDDICNHVYDDDANFAGITDERVDKLIQRVRSFVGKERLQTKPTLGYVFNSTVASKIDQLHNLSAEEAELLKAYRSLAKADKKRAVRHVKNLAQSRYVGVKDERGDKLQIALHI